MANSKQILQKLARNAKNLGLTVLSESTTAVVIDNSANPITISYVDASFSPSVVGGIDSSVSPFLGIGVSMPGKVRLMSASGTTVPTILDGEVAAKVFGMCASLANDIILVHTDAVTVLATVRGHSDLIGVGQ